MRQIGSPDYNIRGQESLSYELREQSLQNKDIIRNIAVRFLYSKQVLYLREMTQEVSGNYVNL
jgi:hypothetical protein